MKIIRVLLIVLALTFALFAKDVATVTGVVGSGFIQRGDKKISIAPGIGLQKNDRIITDSNAKIQIIFNDETIVTLGKNSNFSIKEYMFDDSEKSSMNFSMLQGAMRTITGKIGKVAPRRFSVNTKTATIGIRGTNFTLLVGRNGDQRAFCTYGAIVVATKYNEYLVRQGFYANISPNGMVNIRKFSPKDIRTMKRKLFGLSTKRVNNKSKLREERELDTTRGTFKHLPGKKIGDSVGDVVQQTSVGAGSKKSAFGYAISKNQNDSLYLMEGEYLEDVTIGKIKVLEGKIYQCENKVYTLAPMGTFESRLLTYFNDVTDSDGDVIKIYTGSDNFIIGGDSGSDYVSWGKWNIKYEIKDHYGDVETIQNEGMWIVGNQTPVDVIDAFDNEVRYRGGYLAYDYNNNRELIDGQASLDVDFGNDEAVLFIDYGSGYNFDMDIDGNTMADSNNGDAEGAFYGPNAEAVGGEFLIKTTTGEPLAKGVYAVIKE